MKMIKYLIKNLIKRITISLLFILHITGIMRFYFKIFLNNNATILLYHEIGTKEFKRHIKYLKKYCNVIPLSLLSDTIRNKGSLPKNSVIITFDDGKKSLYQLLPLIKKHAVPVTIYISPGIIEKNTEFWFDTVIRLNETYKINNLDKEHLKRIPDEEKNKIIREFSEKYNYLPAENIVMNWNEVKNMHDSGFVEIGAHTMNHPCLTKIGLKKAEQEIFNSKKMIEKKLGKRISSFSYPNGDFNDSIVSLAKKEYENAVIVCPGYNNRNTNPYMLKRILAGSKEHPLWLLFLASGLYLRLIKNK